MKKILFLFLLLGTFTQVNAGSFIYPIDQIAVPKCRFSNWSELGSDCKMTLPRIVKGDYTKYKNDTNIRRIYSILWGATYNYGWDVGYGSHLGVDIATSAGTPVRSIGDGEVVTAGLLNGRGNTVVIKHKLSDGKYIYSNYAHMSKVTTKKGSIKAGELIGEVGATGNAYGNHLHFQIDITNQSHPYWYTTCSKGIDIMSVVNDGMCKDFLTTNTIDPILFLESNGTYSDVTISSVQQQQTQTKKIEQKNIKSREEILQEEITEFLKTHSFELKTNVSGDNLKTNTAYVGKLFAYTNGKEFVGNMPGVGIYFSYDKKILNINPASIIIAEKGGRNVIISSKKGGRYPIELKLGKNTIATKYINFYAPGDLSNPTDATIITNTKQNIAIGDEKLGAIIMKTNFGSNQVYIPYDGTYKLKSLSGKVKFCNVSKKADKTCNYIDYVQELQFNYADTKYGILIFSMIAFDYNPIKIALTKIGSKHDIARTKYDISVSNPNRLDTVYPYYNECIDSIKKGYVKLNAGYLLQEREITGKQVKNLINNYYTYEYFKAGNNNALKNIILLKLKNAQQLTMKINDYSYITRGAFAKLLFDVFNINSSTNLSTILLDEKGIYEDYMITLRTKYSFKWQDQFGSNYFQPDKNITLGEGLYLLQKIINQK